MEECRDVAVEVPFMPLRVMLQDCYAQGSDWQV